MLPYQHLFFDLDHTLWDFDANSSVVLAELFVQYDLEQLLKVDMKTFIEVFEARNEQLWDRYRKGFINRETLRWKRFWLAMLDFKYADEALSKSLSETYLLLLPQQKLLLPHAIEVLDYCRSKGYQMHIITNGFETTQYQKMEHAGIKDYFDQMITSETSMSLKPHKAIFEYALTAAKATIDNSVMIGDNWEVDVQGARQIGIDQVYYNPKVHNPVGEATFTITCLKELKSIL